MNIQELGLIARHALPIKTIIFNNHGYGASFRDQHRRFGDRLVGTELHNPDFVKLAESFGARGIQVPLFEDTPEAIRDAIAGGRPTVIEVELPAELDPPYYLQPPRE